MRKLGLLLLICACDAKGDLAMTLPDLSQLPDLSAAPGSDLSVTHDLLPSSDMAQLAHKRIFVSSGTWNGDLKTAGGGATGLAGADSLCHTAAMAAALGGSWIAWLSDGSTNAIDRVTDVGPWYLLNDTKVFNNKAGLTGSALTAINITENGATVPNDINHTQPWTGTLTGGTKDATNNCTNFATAAAGNGMCGSTGSAANWTQGAARPCSIVYSLYCIEQ